jgi:hypothetical protein
MRGRTSPAASVRTATDPARTRLTDPATFRCVLIHDQDDRDAIASQLFRYRDGRGDDWVDIIDMLTIHPEERRNVVRVIRD